MIYAPEFGPPVHATRELIVAAHKLATFHEETPEPRGTPRHKLPLAERQKDPDVARFHAELAEYRKRHPAGPKLGEEVRERMGGDIIVGTGRRRTK